METHGRRKRSRKVKGKRPEMDLIELRRRYFTVVFRDCDRCLVKVVKSC